MPPLVLLWLAACGQGKPEGGPDPVETAGPGGDSGSTVPAEETCDGVDNDGDGRVDEGFADQDADGLADCLDRTCTPVVASVTWGALPECEGEVVDPYVLDRRWEATELNDEADPGTVLAPVAGRLDAGGEVVLEVTDNHWGANVLAGADGAWRWSVDAYVHDSCAFADVDGDGEGAMICAVSTLTIDPWELFLVAYDPTGALLWESPRHPYVDNALYDGSMELALADLDADGDVEVVSNYAVYDATDGALLVELETERPFGAWEPVTGDIDGDGDQEIVLAGTVFEPDGRVVWAHPTPAAMMHWNVLVNADADDDAEVVAIHEQYELFDTDGTVLVPGTGAFVAPGRPCVADFDGDGATEVVVSDNARIRMLELDGTEVWSVTNDARTSGCTAWDPDADGDYEVLVYLQAAFWILDGRDGALLFADQRHFYTYPWHHPIVADVNGDGAAEIIEGTYPGNGSDGPKVVAWSNPTWPAAGPIWPLRNYAVTNINDDGTIPSVPDPHWLVEGAGLFRARPAGPVYGPDLVVSGVGACVASCWDDGLVQVAVQVGNIGLRRFSGPVDVALYDADGVERSRVAVDLDLVPQGASPDVLFEIPAPLEDAVLTVSIDPDDEQAECVESDNTWTVVVPGC